MPTLVEYIWIDGQKPTKKLRSKTKVLYSDVNGLVDVPDWSFDGSSTEQAEPSDSDCILKPICLMPDPIRGKPHFLVLCEVLDSDGSPHPSNTRAKLREVVDLYGESEPWFGIEQEYTLYDKYGERPYRWPQRSNTYPEPQGPYYCGVGCDEVYGRDLEEKHLILCLEAGFRLSGTNGEVMPAQWEFQVGPLGPLEVSDQLWLARWLLYRLGEDYEICVKLDPKPVSGDWNGAGAHANFSTKEMREAGGIEHIKAACEKLEKTHKEHTSVYGADNDQRLTGKHETCDIDTFRWGVSDRGASIRIPVQVNKDGCGYLEDRRPAANMDPYEVCRALMETVCGDGFKE